MEAASFFLYATVRVSSFFLFPFGGLYRERECVKSVLFYGGCKKSRFYLVSSKKCRTFAVLLRKGHPKAVENRDVVQLVVYLVWDQVVARSSRVIPTNKGA